MTDETNQDELIEQYLQGELRGEELAQFEEKVSSDEQLKKEVALQRAIIKNIKIAGRQDWAGKLEKIHQDMVTPVEKEKSVVRTLAPVRKIAWKKYFLAAASVLLVILSAVFVFKKKSGLDSKEILLAYYQPFADIQQTTRSTPPDSVSEKGAAFKAYNDHNYVESIRLFKNIVDKKKDELSLFYLGNAYLANDQAAEAEGIFKNYLAEFKEFRAESEWYLSFSYLKQGKEKEAIALLETIANEGNDFSKKAKEILAK